MALTLFSVMAMAALAILGLVLAANADDAMIHVFGLVLAGFGIVNIFALIHQRVGRPTRPADTAEDGDDGPDTGG